MTKFAGLAIAAAALLLAVSLVPCSLASSSIDSERITPLMLDVQDAPVPFVGSDGRTHLVYELWMKNFTSGKVAVEKVEILGDGAAVIRTLDTTEISSRLQPAGLRQPTSIMAPSSQALLFVHVVLPDGQVAPHTLTHRVLARAEAAPPGMQEITETGGDISPSGQPVVIGPPLRGDRYVAADSCCDASRHTRAALPVNGRVWIAQRYAVDWEQLDDQGRIYHGPAADVASYAIYGKEILAVADAKVVSVIDGLPNQTPGQYPTNIPIDQADGNCVVLDLGGSRYGLYAHIQPGGIRVRPGDAVKRGQVIGLVGNSGNSVAPHLHFHVMSTPLPLASNGLPYEIDSYQITATSPSTAAFDEAEAKGTPLPVAPVSPPRHVTNGLPLDQLIISFAP